MKTGLLIFYVILSLLGLVVVLHYVLKSLERALDRMFPTPYDQKGERGGGYEYPFGVRV